MEACWTKTGEECLTELKVDVRQGLSESDIEQRQKKYGKNGERQLCCALEMQEADLSNGLCLCSSS